MKFNIAHLTSCEVLKRVGACVLAFALAFCFVARPVRAEAAIIEGTSALGIAAAQTYFTSTGIGLTVIEGGASAGTAAVSAAANSYVAATGAAVSGDALLASVGAGVSISAGTLVLTAAAAALLAGFAVWCYSEYVDSATGDSLSPVLSGTSVSNLGISEFRVTDSSVYTVDILHYGTGFSAVGDSVQIADDVYLMFDSAGPYSGNFVFVDGVGNKLRYGTGTIGANYQIYAGSAYAGSEVVIDNDHPIYFGTTSLDSYSLSTDLYALVYNARYDSYQRTTWSGSSPYTTLVGFRLSAAGGRLVVPVDNSVVTLSGTYTAPPEVAETAQLEIAGLPDVDIAQLPGAVADATAAGTLTVSPPVSVPLAPPLPDWDPPLGSGDGGIEEPENPGTENPWLPNITVPWHYVVATIKNSAEYIALVVAVISTLLPTSLQAVLWAAVVLALLFGLIRRFLG